MAEKSLTVTLDYVHINSLRLVLINSGNEYNLVCAFMILSMILVVTFIVVYIPVLYVIV